MWGHLVLGELKAAKPAGSISKVPEETGALSGTGSLPRNFHLCREESPCS